MTRRNFTGGAAALVAAAVMWQPVHLEGHDSARARAPRAEDYAALRK